MSYIGTTNYFFEAARGNLPGVTTVNKFGTNPSLAISGYEDVWSGGDIYTPPQTAQVHNLASTAAADAGTLITSGTLTSDSGSHFLDDTGADFVAAGVQVDDYILNDSGVSIGPVSAITTTQLTIVAGMRNPLNAVNGELNMTGQSYRVVRQASTGVSFTWVTGLNALGVEIEEFVILNGTTDVPTLNSYYRQDNMRIFANRNSGTTEGAGTITFTGSVDAQATCQVPQGQNQSLTTFFTVPLGKVAYITNFWAALTGKAQANVTFRLKRGDKGGTAYLLHISALARTGTSVLQHPMQTPVLVGGGIDIWVDAEADTAGTPVSAGYDLILIDP